MNRVNQIDTSLLMLAYEIGQQNPSMVIGSFNNIESLKLSNPDAKHYIDDFVNMVNKQPPEHRAVLVRLLRGEAYVDNNNTFYQLYITLRTKHPVSLMQAVFDAFHK